MGAYRLPKATEAEQHTRNSAVNQAMLSAAHVPLHTAMSVVRVMELAARCARDGNVNAISDAASAAAMARAALAAAGYNVRANLSGHPDKFSSAKMLSDLKDLEARGHSIDQEIRETLLERAKLESPAG